MVVQSRAVEAFSTKTKMAAANDLIDEEKTTTLKAFFEKIYVFPSLSATQ